MNTKLIRIASISFGILLLAASAISAQSTSGQLQTTPKLEIITPGEGQTIYGNKVPVLLSVENFDIVDYQQNTKPAAGQGHIHLWLDDTNPTAQSATKVVQDSHTFSNVAYGDHTLRAELVTNDHKSFVPPQVITINFKNEIIPSAAETETSGLDKKTAFLILIVVALVIIAAWWYTKEEEGEMETVEKAKPVRKSKSRRSTKKKDR